jgi:hypothetical protein
VSIGDASVVEGTDGPPTDLSFPVTLNQPYPFDLELDFEVLAGTAMLYLDYYPPADAFVEIPRGSTRGFLIVSVGPDVIDERDETVIARLTSAGGAPGVRIVRDLATGTILDDDAPPGILIDQPSAAEGDGHLRFVVALTGRSGLPVGVTFRTANGTAAATADYTQMGVSNTVPCPVPPSASTGSPCILRFEPGDTAIAVDVPLVDDAVSETSETLLLRLFDPINATLDVAQATGTIIDDDPITVQESSASITYVKTWKSQTVTGASGGNVRYAGVLGSKATLIFTGRRIEVLSTRGPNRGKVAVLLDGVKVATVDLYAATTQPAAAVFTRAFTTSGQHAVQLKVLGKKNASSNGKRVDLDAFRYLR